MEEETEYEWGVRYLNRLDDGTHVAIAEDEWEARWEAMNEELWCELVRRPVGSWEVRQ